MQTVHVGRRFLRRLIRVYIIWTYFNKGDHLTREIILIRIFNVIDIYIYIAVGISDDIADIADSKSDQGLHCLLMPACPPT